MTKQNLVRRLVENIQGYYIPRPSELRLKLRAIADSREGFKLTLEGRFEEAIEFFKGEIETHPNYIAYYGYANTLYANHQEKQSITGEVVDEAIRNYELSLQENPDFPSANLCAGVMYRHKIELLTKQNTENLRGEAYQDETLSLIKNSRYHIKKSFELDPNLRDCAIEELRKLEKLEFQLYLSVPGLVEK